MIHRLKVKIVSLLLKSLKGKHENWSFFLKTVQNSVGSGDVLRDCLKMDQELYLWTTYEAGKLSEGHPKHKYLRYFDWFAQFVDDQDRVLDVGCGKGELTKKLADKTKASVVGIEIDQEKVTFCQSTHVKDNLKFIQGDVTQVDIKKMGQCDVITLSNVLEHIDERQQLLQTLQTLHPKRLLVRVPQFDRDWRVPVKRDLGIDYFLDPTHVLEYTYDQLEQELQGGGFKIVDKQFNWGEIWVVSEPL